MSDPRPSRAKRIRLGILGGAVIMLAIPLGYRVMKDRRDAAALESALSDARAAGIPTKWQEYAATIKPCPPEENAAEFYRGLKAVTKGSTDLSRAERNLLHDPSANAIAAAKRILASRAQQLSLADRAVTRPRCWFDRNWSEGAAVLMPELAYMKWSARIVSLRASVAAAEGRNADALSDVEKLLTIAKHAGEEGHEISQAVYQSIYEMALRDLAVWSFRDRKNPVFSEALRKAIAGYEKPNLQAEHASDLYGFLELVEQVKTPEGLQQIGLKPSDIPAISNVIPLLFDQGQAKVEVVREHIAYWKALGEEPPDVGRAEDALHRRDAAMMVIPVAGDVFIKLSSGGTLGGRAEAWRADMVRYQAALRALSGPTIPKRIATNDLLSPYDKKPITYRFDGKQIVIVVSGEEGDPFTIPPAPLNAP